MIQFPKYEYNNSSEDKKDSPFELYQKAVQRCDDPKKTQLQNIERVIESHYDEYEREFNQSNVHSINRHGLNEADSDNLKSLYSSNSAIAKTLRKDYESRLTNRSYYHKCPYCTFGESNTLEHILPKTPYPEYAINALNLIPCCSQCNSYKGEKVKDDKGYPETINFYYHNPDSFQFLETDFLLDENGVPLFTYKLCFPKDCDTFLMEIIENHFKNLHLVKRYNEQVISLYTSFETMIISNYKKQQLDMAFSFIDSYLKTQTTILGQNHYQVALLRCLNQSADYKSYLSEKLKS